MIKSYYNNDKMTIKQRSNDDQPKIKRLHNDADTIWSSDVSIFQMIDVQVKF